MHCIWGYKTTVLFVKQCHWLMNCTASDSQTLLKCSHPSHFQQITLDAGQFCDGPESLCPQFLQSSFIVKWSILNGNSPWKLSGKKYKWKHEKGTNNDIRNFEYFWCLVCFWCTRVVPVDFVLKSLLVPFACFQLYFSSWSFQWRLIFFVQLSPFFHSILYCVIINSPAGGCSYVQCPLALFLISIIEWLWFEELVIDIN